MVKFLRYLFPPLFETIQVEYMITDADIGIMYSLLLVTYGFMQFPSGYLSDRFNERIVITVGGITFGVASLLIFISSPYWSLIAAVILMGIGTGMHKTVAINLVSRMYPKNKGLSLGVMDTVGQGGGIFAPVVIVIVLAYAIPWRMTFALGFVLTILLVFAFRWSVRRQERRDREIEVETDSTEPPTTPTESDDTAITSISYLQLFRQYHFSAFVAVSTIFTFTWTGFVAFFPLYLMRIGGLSGSVAGILYSFLFFLTVTQVVTGGLSDRFNSIRLILVLFGMIGGGLVALILWPSLVPLIVITLVLGVGLHGFRPVREAYFMDIIPTTIGGGALGLVRSIMSVTGAASPAIMGAISDSVGLTNSFILLFGVVAAGIGIIVTMSIVPMPAKEDIEP